MFGDRALKVITYSFGQDPAADASLPIFVAPEALTIKSANLTTNATTAGGTVNFFDVALWNGGTSGTANGVVAGTVGGTVGWVALTSVPFTVTNGYMTAGQLLRLRYDETGTATIQGSTLTISYVNGKGNV